MIRLVGALFAMLVSSACYTLHPVLGVELQNGARVGLEINDAGRVALAGAMGPEISVVEGRLRSKESNDYVVAVSSVQLLRGGEQVWKGEPISIRNDFVSRIYERRLSTGRTVSASVAGAGVVLFLVTRAIVGAGLGDEGRLPGDTTHRQRRPARP